MAKGYDSLPTTTSAPADPTPSLKQKMVAEVIGTYILVQVGCGGLCAMTYLGVYSGLWQAASVWLVAGFLGVSAVSKISGGHLNPAVTLAFALVRPDDFAKSHIIPYMLSQLSGGFLAGVTNLMIYSTAIASYESANGIERGTADGIKSAGAFGDYWSLSDSVGSFGQAVFIEAFGAAFLVMIIFAVTNPANNIPSASVPVTVGVAIGSMIALLGATTGAGINPARDFGPRLATCFFGWGGAALKDSIAYIVGPLIGGPIGAYVADNVLFKG